LVAAEIADHAGPAIETDAEGERHLALPLPLDVAGEMVQRLLA
jgi:hypothetical protein